MWPPLVGAAACHGRPLEPAQLHIFRACMIAAHLPGQPAMCRSTAQHSEQRTSTSVLSALLCCSSMASVTSKSASRCFQ